MLTLKLQSQNGVFGKKLTTAMSNSINYLLDYLFLSYIGTSENKTKFGERGYNPLQTLHSPEVALVGKNDSLKY